MTDAKPDVGALVARAIEYHAKMHRINSEICGKFWDVGAAAEAQEHADFHQALLALQAEVARLTQQLPESMQHCTILFKECEKGHGWLTATNWVQHGCPTCESARLTQENARLAGEAAARDAKIRRLEWTIEALDKGGPPR